MCRWVLPGVNTDLSVQKDIVYISWPNPLSKSVFREVRVGQWSLYSQMLLLPPGRPSYAGAGDASHSVIPMATNDPGNVSRGTRGGGVAYPDQGR